MLFATPPAKRTLRDLQVVIEQAVHAQKYVISLIGHSECLHAVERLFASLASDKSPMIPYNRDIADQRRKYGDNMLKKGDEHLASQGQFEAEGQARLDAARRKRQDEKERQEALEVS